jgi:thiamine pyrophosphokinase
MAYSDKARLGIAFLGGEGPAPALIRSLLAAGVPATDPADRAGDPLAVDCAGPLVAAADSGLLLAESAGFRPRWIIGDMDSLGAESERLASYPPAHVIRCPPDKDYTDTELAFSLLREQGCGEIWLVGGGGGRTDHLFALRSLFERDNPPARWISAREDIRCLEAGSGAVPGELSFPPAEEPGDEPETDLFTGEPETGPLSEEPDGPDKTGPGTGPISVFPLGAGPWKALSRGLKWPLDDLPWNRGFFGLSNEAPEGRFTIKALEGRFMVIAPLRMEQGGEREG